MSELDIWCHRVIVAGIYIVFVWMKMQADIKLLFFPYISNFGGLYLYMLYIWSYF